jgi:hypothetical protein
MESHTRVMALPSLIILAGKGAGLMAQTQNVGERDLIAAQLQRFGTQYRPRLIACAALSDRIAQVSITFPVLFFALATRYGPIEHRRRAIHRAVDGYALADIAQALRLPLCFRHIPPEACHDALPYVHWSTEANKRFEPHVPRSAQAAAQWIVGVSRAARTCDEEFAYWLSRQRGLLESKRFGTSAILPMALYAWHGQQPGLTPPLRPARRWSAQANARTAVTRSAAWLNSIKMEIVLGSIVPVDPWLPASTYRGYSFHPLTTACALHQEADVMNSCVESYSWPIANNKCRLFSMQRRGERIATLEVRPHKLFDSYAPVQLKGPSNSECVLELWHAASKWIEWCDRRPSERPTVTSAFTADDRLHEILTPYREAMSARCSEAPRITFASLSISMRRLYRCVGLL